MIKRTKAVSSRFDFACANCGFVSEHDGDCPICEQAPDKKVKEINLYDLIFELQDKLQKPTPSPDLIRQARELYQQTTEGEWFQHKEYGWVYVGDRNIVNCPTYSDADMEDAKNNAAFIVFTKNNLPALLDLAEQVGRRSTTIDVQAIKERNASARGMVTALNLPYRHPQAREWLMSIPARPDYDPDLIISASLHDVGDLLDKVAELEAEVERLKAEIRPANRCRNFNCGNTVERDGLTFFCPNCHEEKEQEVERWQSRAETAEKEREYEKSFKLHFQGLAELQNKSLNIIAEEVASLQRERDDAKARDAEECKRIVLDYMAQCEQTGCDLSEKEDEISKRMYWRANGAADALEIVAQKIDELLEGAAKEAGENG